MNVARAITAARLQAGITQTTLARRAGTSQATVSAYESGTKGPSAETLVRIIAATGSRLAVEPGPGLALVGNEAADATARELLQVIELAEHLPTEHADELHYPVLPRWR